LPALFRSALERSSVACGAATELRERAYLVLSTESRTRISPPWQHSSDAYRGAQARSPTPFIRAQAARFRARLTTGRGESDGVEHGFKRPSRSSAARRGARRSSG